MFTESTITEEKIGSYREVLSLEMAGDDGRKKIDSSECLSVYRKEVETSFLDTAKKPWF